MSEVGPFEAMRRASEVRAAIIASAKSHRATIGQTFRAFDQDGDKIIAPLEMLHGLRALHVPEQLDFLLDLEAAISLVETFDLDHDGKLTEQDWRDYFRQMTPDEQLALRPANEEDWALGSVADPPLGIGRTASEDTRADDIGRMSSRADWHDSLREFDTGIELGTGAFGKVHLWTEKSTGRQFACKKINKLELDAADMVSTSKHDHRNAL